MAVNGRNKGAKKYDYSDQPVDDSYYGLGFGDDLLDRIKGINVRGLDISGISITADTSALGCSWWTDNRIDGSILQRPTRQITAQIKIPAQDLFGFNESYRRKAIEEAELKVRDELFRSFNQFVNIDKFQDYDGTVSILARIDVCV